MTSRLPDFLIIGAMRSGTTSLSVYLGAHPNVFIPEQKEIRFFDRHFANGSDWYREQFRGAGERAVVGEASPGYMYLPQAVSRMAEALPDARLIALLRDPVDRAYSHYWMNQALGKESLSFTEALAQESERIARGARRADYSYMDRGRYVRQLLDVSAHYPREQLHVVLFDDLERNPLETYRDVCRFLRIDADHVPRKLGTAVNRFVTFRSLDVWRSARERNPLARRVLERANTRRRSSYPPLEPAVRMALAEEFEADNRALEGWLGRSLAGWTRVPAATG